MSKINHNIKNQFPLFQELLRGNKVIAQTSISMKDKVNNPFWLLGASSAKHESIEEQIDFTVEKSKRENKYGVKLKCAALSEEPFIRFDSDGPSHRNHDSSIPLDEQSVSTPHFNSFNERGKAIAYKNEVLKKESEAKEVVNDVDFGVALFCGEVHAFLENKNYPKVIYNEPELPFEEDVEPLDNIRFE